VASTSAAPPTLSNAEIARRLLAVAQMLGAKGENPFKIKAYRRAAETVKNLGESVDALVRSGGDVTRFPGIGKGIAAALREIVYSGKLGQLEMLLANAPPETAALNEYPTLDPKRVARVYKKLGIGSVAELKESLDSGKIAAAFGARMDAHFRDALCETHPLLLIDADLLAQQIAGFLLEKCGAHRAEIVGEVRRRVEVVNELALLVETDDFAATRERLSRYGGGRLRLIESTNEAATFQLPDSVTLSVGRGTAETWGLALIAATGSAAHIEQLEQRPKRATTNRKSGKQFREEADVYAARGLAWIPPELREGRDEIARAAQGKLPELVEVGDIRGELHAHTTSSDGAHSIEEMAAAAQTKGYDYLGITDHSQSLKIAGGVSVNALWAQIKRIDRLNRKLSGFRILKSAEVDILADGTLDYPDDLLAELDYTVCSIHSRFRLGKQEQTERILRAMDHPAFTILGHATGRLLLRRPGYEIDVARVIAHAKARGCFFEINASPDRLDLSAESVKEAVAAGIKIAVCTDAHHRDELDWMRGGIDVARRGGLQKDDVLNTRSWAKLQRLLRR
jgi:DNA polymerase (family 10)